MQRSFLWGHRDMAAKPPWWKWIERNKPGGAKALAAAGILAESGHNPYSRRDQGWLDGLLHNPDSQVRWRYPDQRVVSAVTDGDLHDLSAAWDRAVGERKVDHGVRLVIDVDALTAPGTGISVSEIPDVAQALVGPSMEVPASGKQTDVGAVSFACSVAYQAHEWQWPMRFAVDSEVSAAL